MNHHEGPPYTNEWCKDIKVEMNKIKGLAMIQMKPHKEILEKTWNSGKEKITTVEKKGIDIMSHSGRRIEITMKQE